MLKMLVSISYLGWLVLVINLCVVVLILLVYMLGWILSMVSVGV